MLKVRVIPILLVTDTGLVKGEGFNAWRRIGPVLPAVNVYQLRDVDELLVLDIQATTQGRSMQPDLVHAISRVCGVPLTVGGGIDSLQAAQHLFDAGADRIVLNSAAYSQPSLIGALAEQHGSQSVVVALDAKRQPEGWECFSHCGKRATGRHAVDWARHCADLGAGELIVTSIDHEGRMGGYGLELISSVADAVGIPVIASGGAGTPSDARLAISEGGASAVAAASMFHFSSTTPLQVKLELREAGIPTRIHAP